MFRQAKRRVAGRKNFEDSNVFNTSDQALFDQFYSSRLNLYDFPPLDEITLEEFETWAIDRLKILIEIESSALRGKHYKEIEQVVQPMLAKLLPLTSNSSKNTSLLVKERKKDHYSHFILRLAFCRSEELRSRFVKAETVLFKIRFNSLTIQEQKQFINSINLPWEFVEESEKLEHEKELFDASYGGIRSSLNSSTSIVNDEQVKKVFQNETFLKVPFQYVLDLVATRQVFIHNAYCFVPQFLQLNLISSEFANKLEKSLIMTMKALPRLDEDDRLLPVLNNLSNGYVVDEMSSYEKNREGSDEINAANLASKKEFMPLCMQHLLEGLQQTNHLKYAGRQQLGRFIKEMGVSLQESLQFWRQSFKVTNFDKDYSYNIKHTYGAVGGRIKYRGMNCTTIMNQPKAKKGSEYHGCFYKDLSTDDLVMSLKKSGIREDLINGILDASRNGKYQIACTMVLEAKCGGKSMPTVTHPNFFFEEALKESKKAGPE